MKIKHEDKNEINFSHKNVLLIIFFIAVAVRVFTVINYGENLKIFVDDRHYLYGAVNFIKTGHIPGNPASEHTVISMPGTYLWLAALMKIFGYTQSGLHWVRISLGIIDCFSLLGVYKFAKEVLGVRVALFSALFYAIGIPFVCSSVLTMSDSLTIFGLVWFFYFAVKYCKTKKDTDFLLMFFFYFIALLQRTTVAFIPITLIVFYWKNKFPIKLLISRCIYAICLLCVLLAPWWYRNYLITDTFLPTTVGGDAFLGGTYYFDFELKNEMPFNEARVAFSDATEEDSVYQRMLRESDYAKERIKNAWAYDKSEFLKTYLLKKPYYSWRAVMVRGIIFDISSATQNQIYKVTVLLACCGFLVGLLQKKKQQGTLFCMFGIIYYSIFTAIFLPFAGYNFPAYFFGVILAAIAVEALSIWGAKGYIFLSTKIKGVSNENTYHDTSV